MASLKTIYMGKKPASTCCTPNINSIRSHSACFEGVDAVPSAPWPHLRLSEHLEKVPPWEHASCEALALEEPLLKLENMNCQETFPSLSAHLRQVCLQAAMQLLHPVLSQQLPLIHSTQCLCSNCSFLIQSYSFH